MTLKAPRSKPQMLSKPRSSVSVMACPMEDSPHITSLELAPDFCWEIKYTIQQIYFCLVIASAKSMCMYARAAQLIEY